MLIAWRRCSSLYAGPVWSESERVWSMFLFDFLISPVKVGMLPSKVRYLDLERKVNRHPQIFLPKWELQHHLKLWKISGEIDQTLIAGGSRPRPSEGAMSNRTCALGRLRMSRCSRWEPVAYQLLMGLNY